MFIPAYINWLNPQHMYEFSNLIQILQIFIIECTLTFLRTDACTGFGSSLAMARASEFHAKRTIKHPRVPFFVLFPSFFVSCIAMKT